MRILSNAGLALGLSALTLVSCGDDEPDVEDGFANLRAMNLVIGPDIDVVLNQSADPIAADVGFTDSSDYEKVAIGTYTLEVRNSDGQTLLTTDITLENRQSYTFVIFDRPDSVRGTLFQDQFGIPSGEIRTRLFNMAIGRGGMALYFIPDDGGAPQRLTDDVMYGQASSFAGIEDGDHDVGLDVDLDGTVDVFYDLPPLSDGTLANLFAVFDDNGDLDLILQLNDGFTWDLDGQGDIGGAQARLRAIHLISGAPAVSLFTAGSTITTGLNFMQESVFVGAPAGAITVDIAETGAGLLGSVMKLSIEAGADYTLVLFGTAAAPQIIAIRESSANVPNDQVRVRMIHTAQGFGELDFFDLNAGGQPILWFENLDFGQESATVDLTPGSYRLAVDVNNDNVFEAFFDTPVLPAGQLVTFYAVIDNGNPVLVTQTNAGIMSSPMVIP